MSQPRRLLGVFWELLDSGAQGIEQMNAAVREICAPALADPPDRSGLSRLLSHARDWNTNSKSSRVAQALLTAVLTAVGPDTLRQVDGIKHLVESILPYSERHFARLDRLHRASYLLDYTLHAMKTAVASDAGLPSAVSAESGVTDVAMAGVGEGAAWIKRQELHGGGEEVDDAYTLDEGEADEETLEAVGGGRAIAVKRKGRSGDELDDDDEEVVAAASGDDSGSGSGSDSSESDDAAGEGDSDEESASEQAEPEQAAAEEQEEDAEEQEQQVDDPHGNAAARARRHPAASAEKQKKRKKRRGVVDQGEEEEKAKPKGPSPRRLRSRK